MDRLPDLYIRILNIRRECENLYQLTQALEMKNTDESVVVSLYNSMQRVYTYFWRYIRDLYKEQNILFFLPKEILLNGLKDKIIPSKMDFLLEYIKDNSALSAIIDTKGLLKVKRQIVTKYCDKFHLINEFMNSNDKVVSYFEKYVDLAEQYSKTVTCFDTSTPNGVMEALHIPEKSYIIIMDFLKQNKSIKSVWLHGSRLYGTYHKGSDIDLIFDCSEDELQKIRKGLLALPVPYFFDCINANIKSDDIFFKLTAIKGTKRIL